MLIGIQKQSKPLFMYLRENTTEANLEILFRSNLSSTETIPLINKANQLAGVYIMRVLLKSIPERTKFTTEVKREFSECFISNIFSACLKLGDITSPVSGGNL